MDQKNSEYGHFSRSVCEMKDKYTEQWQLNDMWMMPRSAGYSSDVACSYFFRPIKVTEHVTSRVSGGKVKIK